ncbi:MAG: MFS transporter [Parachlamydia sp.]|nr:MFS transporter [Parachlamydia sp.]
MKRLISWALYDFASSAYSTIILTFIFATYFVKRVAPDATEGAAVWGFAMGFSGLIVAIGGPFLGSLADQGGGRKRWLGLFSILCALSALFMWFILPSPTYMWPALILATIGSASIEFAYIFYNAMLPELCTPQNVGRWSGWGWAMGYVGGVIALILCLVLFIGRFALFSLDQVTGQEERATFLLCAIWYVLFAIPIFLYIPSTEATKPINTSLFKNTLQQLASTFRQIRSYANLFRFLIARMLFNDALLTLFAFGGVYAASVFNMSEERILYFGVSLNITAGLGAASFALLDDRIGGKQTIMIALIGLIFTGTAALLAQTEAHFWIAGLLLGLFVGPAQASSRSYMARKAPVHLRNEMFGFFALSARVTAFLGPMLLGWLTYLTASMRIGMASIIALLVIGFVLMILVEKDL